MGEWKEVELSAIADVQTGPFGSQLHASDYVPVGVPVIMPNNIGQRLTLNEANMNYITEADATRLARYKVRENDIVFSRRGDVDKCILIDARKAGWFCGTGCLFARLNSKVVDPTFVAYQFDSPELKNWLRTNAVGTTMPNLNSTILERAPVALPEMPEQRAIASVLSSLDAKIDLLHRQNKTLEAMAETLFRQWFVEEAEEGWEEGTLGDIMSVQGGTTPSTQNAAFWDGEYCWTTPRDLSGDQSLFLFDTARKLTEEGLKQIGSGLLPVGTLLLSSRAPIGYTAFAAVPVAINQGYIAINANEGYSNYFIYLWLKANMETVKGHANGSTFQEISKSAFKTIEITIPPKERVEEFDRVVESLFDKVKSNQVQTQNLTKLRDTLLPKLMSGEVRVEVL
jgi:type I restriction enzyme S subunit